jgi:glycosyltransferase involved in cell wall biosynthesis
MIDRHDYIIISENPPTFFITLIAIIPSIVFDTKIIIWNEAWDEDIIPKYQDQTPKQKIAETIFSAGIRSYRRLIYKSADGFVAFSHLASDYLTRLGVSREQIIISRQIIPEEQLPKPSRSVSVSKFFNDSKVSYLYLGYIRPSKGIELLLDSFKELHEKNGDCELIVAGRGNRKYEEKIVSKIQNIENINFVGYVEGGQKASYYHYSDILVCPTYRDAWGLVINEALYYGSPVITTDAAGGKEIIGDNGLIIPSGDRRSLTNVMRLCQLPEVLEQLKPKTKHSKILSDPDIMASALITACED